MSTIVIPMRKASGDVVELSQILGVVPKNSWAWSILSLWGTGVAPQGMTMQSFEDLVESSESGYPLSWRELVGLASHLEQVHDCLIAAANSPDALSRPVAEQDSHPDLLVVIDGQDSTQWDIKVNDDLDGAMALKERLASLAREGDVSV